MVCSCRGTAAGLALVSLTPASPKRDGKLPLLGHGSDATRWGICIGPSVVADVVLHRRFVSRLPSSRVEVMVFNEPCRVLVVGRSPPALLAPFWNEFLQHGTDEVGVVEWKEIRPNVARLSSGITTAAHRLLNSLFGRRNRVR